MKYKQLSIDGVWLMEPDVFGDQRGYFFESFKPEEFRRHVGDVTFVQENESRSRFGVLRGLHFQAGCHSQAKLVRVTEGRVLDVIVDLRAGSPTRGRYLAIELSGDNHCQLFVPRGFAHGFVTLSPTACFQYKVDNVYAPVSERTIRFDDPTIGVRWPLPESLLIISDKDRKGVSLAEGLTFV
ncbi:MAG: dTDP-4-dehydrorhamnose 3,5-epimerase [Muribaculaceae bacterium]|nr:dTDP-4-dehydrorhamnose 3,5-epimerase [Muribaculaceae bacterium]